MLPRVFVLVGVPPRISGDLALLEIRAVPALGARVSDQIFELGRVFPDVQAVLVERGAEELDLGLRRGRL